MLLLKLAHFFFKKVSYKFCGQKYLEGAPSFRGKGYEYGGRFLAALL